jgi:hypothetical protein
MILVLSGLIAALVFAYFYLALGQTLVSFFDAKQSLSRNEKFFAYFYSGIGIWYIVATALGLTGNFKKEYVGSIILFVLVFTFKKTKLFLKSFAAETFFDLKKSIPDTKFWKYIFWSTILFILLCGMSFIAPIEGDGAAFYMAISKMLASSGFLEKFPGYEGFSAVGLLSELQLASLLLFVNDYAAKGFSWIIFLPTILVFIEFARKLKLSTEGTLITLLSVFTSTGIHLILYGGKVDLFSSALGLSGLYFLFFSRHYFMTGFLLGLACIAKLSLLIPFFPIVVIGILNHWWFEQRDKKSFKELLRLFFVVGIAFLLVFIPHLIKNQVFFSNPFAPFYGTNLKWETEWFAPETTRRIVLTYPLVWFYGDYWAQAGRMSLLMFIFAPFAVLNYRTSAVKSEVRLLALAFFAGLGLWVILRPSFIAPRYIMPVLLLLAPLAGYGFERLKEIFSTGFLMKSVQVILVLWVIHSLINVDRSGLTPRRLKPLLLGKEPCQMDRQHCQAAEVINQVAPVGARVLQLNYFTYWLRADLLQTLMHAEEVNLKDLNSEQTWAALYRRDFKYILHDTATHQYLESLYHLKDLPPWVQLKNLYTLDNVSVYEIQYENPPVSEKDVKVVSNGAGHWQVQELR